MPDFTVDIPAAALPTEEADGTFAVESGLVAAALVFSGAWNVRPADGQPDRRRWFEFAKLN
jgi:hypothetical protein